MRPLQLIVCIKNVTAQTALNCLKIPSLTYKTLQIQQLLLLLFYYSVRDVMPHVFVVDFILFFLNLACQTCVKKQLTE